MVKTGSRPAAAIAVLMLLMLTATIGSVPAEPRATAVVMGTVRDGETGKGIARANVVLEGTLAGAATDQAGNFRITRVPAGSYRLAVSVIGYRRSSLEIAVEQGTDLEVEITLARAPIEIDPVVVTAARRRQDVLDVPVGFSVVTRGDIEKVDAVSPDEVLRYAPGVVVTDTQVDVRGSGGFNRGAGSRMLLLVDGIPALAGDTGDIKWDLVPPDEIQRIEIIKSAASSLYGSTALGGVINIVTLPVSDEPQTRFRLSAGYYDDPYHPEWKWTTDWQTLSGIDLSHARKVGRVGLFVGAGKKKNDGYRRNSDFDRTSLTAKVTYPGDIRLTFFNAWALEKHGHATEWQSQAEALDIDPAARQDRVRSEKMAGYLRARSVLGIKSAVSAALSWYHTDWQNDFHDVKDNARALRLGGSVEVDRIISPRIEAALGLEGSRTDVESTMFGDRDIADAGVFGEAKAALAERATLNLGVRFDRHKLAGGGEWQGLVSPRAAIVVKTGGTSSLNASVGRGFRAPTIAEMFTSTTVGGFTVKPNPELNPEKGTTWEVGWMGGLGQLLRLGLGLFRSDYDDLIEPEVDESDGSLHFTNIRDARVSGFDGWAKSASIYDLASLSASYMYLSTEDAATGEPLAYRSKHNLKFSVDVSRRRYTVGADFIYRSRTERVKVYEEDQRVPIYVTDLRGEVTLGRFRLSGKVANLFNYNYTEIERNLAPIRSLRFSLSGVL